MAVNRITKRWLLNSFLIILFILVTIVIVSTFAIRSFFYKSVETEMISRANINSAKLETYAKDSGEEVSTEVRNLVQTFTDRDKMELMAVGLEGNVINTSSGFPYPADSPMPDFKKALSSGGTLAQERYMLNKENVMALTMLLPQSVSSSEIAGLRFIVSLEKIDRQIHIYIAFITAICLSVLLFVIVTSYYFIKSIVLPVEKVGDTARKIAQGDFNVRLKKQHDDEIGDLCDTINDMAEELSQSEKMKNDFISSVSHELRTPLTAIKGWAETLSMDLGGDGQGTGMARKGMHVIISETERLSQMVEELLDFSRIQSGRFKLEMANLDLIAELSDAVLMYTERIKRENMSLVYDEPDYLVMVLGDRNRLRQVFVNIIDNAIKYSDAGGVITISVSRAPGRVTITISDTGCGIKEADLPKVKSKFYKANSTRRGSGIGLAVADEIITQHGGSLTLASREQMGTAVTILIPSVDNL